MVTVRGAHQNPPGPLQGERGGPGPPGAPRSAGRGGEGSFPAVAFRPFWEASHRKAPEAEKESNWPFVAAVYDRRIDSTSRRRS